ncbi:hypothetical protein A2164_01950, partial [Candidatus Curtissbacteria bacterium RBG_13_35_7]
KIQITGFIHPKHSTDNIGFLKDRIKLVKCDILDKHSIFNKINNTDYDYVFHLAAFSSPTQSFQNPKITLENNIIGQLNLLEALVKIKSKAKILIIGSSDEYGEVNKSNLPLNELVPLSPQSPYAVSKVAQDLLGYQFYLHHKLQIVRLRPFNHIGPRQAAIFVVPAFASQIAKLEKIGGGDINVGNLQTWRDFTDVRDIVKGYFLALDKGKIGEVYNIGSGKLYKISDILNQLLSFSKVKINIKKDKKLFRISDNNRIYCDYSKFQKQTGWKPKIPIKKTLFDTIEYERQLLIN